MNQNSPNSPFETISVDKLAVACDGTGGALGHPRVYLHIEQELGKITCPYCSRRYVLGAPDRHVL